MTEERSVIFKTIFFHLENTMNNYGRVPAGAQMDWQHLKAQSLA